MVFKKIIKFAICLIPLMMILSGCVSENGSTKPEGEISSVSISQNHMNRNYCYAFSVYKNDDGYYLNVWCVLSLNDDYRDINFEDISITKEEFDKFAKLDEKYDFFSQIKEGNKDKNKFQPLDETTANFQVSYDDESVNLETSGECYEAVYNYFIELAEKYSE